jgi:hypothetical protein
MLRIGSNGEREKKKNEIGAEVKRRRNNERNKQVNREKRSNRSNEERKLTFRLLTSVCMYV